MKTTLVVLKVTDWEGERGWWELLGLEHPDVFHEDISKDHYVEVLVTEIIEEPPSDEGDTLLS